MKMLQKKIWCNYNVFITFVCRIKKYTAMKKLKKILFLFLLPVLVFSSSFSGCKDLIKLPLSEAEVSRGLREALSIGAVNAILATNKENGYFMNNAIKIPFPDEAQGAMKYMQNSSLLKPLLNEFVKLLNRAAEHAAIKAKPIFADAISGITFRDAWQILRGGEGAATSYLRGRTYINLLAAFKPDVLGSLQAVGAQTVWAELTSAYNTIANITPSLAKINTDLADYTTRKALDGLFHVVEQEENKIRKDPVARVTGLLKRVFENQ